MRERVKEVVVVCSAELGSLQLIPTELGLADDQTLNNQRILVRVHGVQQPRGSGVSTARASSSHFGRCQTSPTAFKGQHSNTLLAFAISCAEKPHFLSLQTRLCQGEAQAFPNSPDKMESSGLVSDLQGQVCPRQRTGKAPRFPGGISVDIDGIL